jgi:radical SAM protein with 4Fe4S-binding SPASM domain
LRPGGRFGKFGRKRDKDHIIDYGDMDFNLLEKIASETPNGTLVQFHWNGEPTLYPRLKDALGLFKHCIRQFDTNGKLLVHKADEIIDNLDVLTVSVIENDLTQYNIVEAFNKIKKSRKPRMIYRCLGDVYSGIWRQLQGDIVKRVLHAPEGSFDYEKEVVKPEHGICLDMFDHLAIDRFGNVSPCVRYDPEGENIIGNINDDSLMDIWNGKTRKDMLQKHINGDRNLINFCSRCNYFGIPVGG